MFFNFLKRKREIKIQQEQPYEYAISRLNESKYCNVNDDEYEFIKLLFTLFEQQKLFGYIKLTRISNKAIDFYYKGYPIGKVKLNGRKTWFSYMSNLYDVKRVEDIKQENFEQLISFWVLYIKKYRL